MRTPGFMAEKSIYSREVSGNLYNGRQTSGSKCTVEPALPARYAKMACWGLAGLGVAAAFCWDCWFWIPIWSGCI